LQAIDAPFDTIINILASAKRDDPEMLARQIVVGLDQAGYEIRQKPDVIPIRRNPGP